MKSFAGLASRDFAIRTLLYRNRSIKLLINKTMKTPFIACVCLLVLVLTSVAQSPPPVQNQPPAQNPPTVPGTNPGAQVPANPAAPIQSPATNVPAGQQPAVPGASIPVTLSPAPGVATSPAAATATSPSPAVSPAAEAQPMMWNGLNHQHTSLQGALQVAAGIEIKRAGRFLVVMDTLVTLAPLLGLLGTITGLIRSFSFLGNEELAVQAVTGGIAEALIATACGLGIAIFALIPFNFFTSRVSNLEFELQTAATNLEVMLEAQHKEHREHRGVEIEHGTPASATRSSI